MNNKGVKEMLNTFSHEGNANNVTGRTGVVGSVAQLIRCLSCKYVEKISILRTHL